MNPTDTTDRGEIDPELERRIRTTLTAVADTVDTSASASQLRSSPSAAAADRRQRRRTLAGIAAALIVVVAGVALWQVTELRDVTPASEPDIPRTSGTIDDPFGIDLDPWRVGAPPWPTEPAGPYVGIVAESFPAGWTVEQISGSHQLNGAWSAGALLTSPTGRPTSIGITDDPSVFGAVERTLELRGTTVTIGDRALWWSEQGVGIRIDVLDERTDGLDEAIELAEAIELDVIERLPGWTPPDRPWDVDHGDVALAGLIDATPWELRVDNGSSTSVLIDGRPVAWGSQPGYTSLNAVGVGEGVIVFGLAPAALDRVVVQLSDDTAITLPVSADPDLPAWAAPIPSGLDVTAIAFVDQTGSTFHQVDVPPIPTPSMGLITETGHTYVRPDGVGLFPDARAVTCTVRRADEPPATFEADPGAVTSAQIGELTIEVDRRSGTAIQVRDRDGTPIASASSGGGSAAIDMIGATLSVDC